jgi:predicted transcriptional regulator
LVGRLSKKETRFSIVSPFAQVPLVPRAHAVLVLRDKYIYIYAEKSEEKLVGDITKTLLSTGL